VVNQGQICHVFEKFVKGVAMKRKLTARDVFDCEIPRLLPENPDIARKVNAVIGVEIHGEEGGYWTLDLTEDSAVTRGKTKEPKCTIIAHAEDFEALLEDGSVRDALKAFKEKRIQANGHIPTILKLESLLRSFNSSK
jgi:hypothetical protein